jgi:hypothetical protein
MRNDRIQPHDGSNEYCPDCEQQIDACACESLSDWFRQAGFDELWELSVQGNEEATEEILARQWEYNEQMGSPRR